MWVWKALAIMLLVGVAPVPHPKRLVVLGLGMGQRVTRSRLDAAFHNVRCRSSLSNAASGVESGCTLNARYLGVPVTVRLMTRNHGVLYDLEIVNPRSELTKITRYLDRTYGKPMRRSRPTNMETIVWFSEVDETAISLFNSPKKNSCLLVFTWMK